MVIKDNLPKVLIVGINAWREDGTAHTLMDIFRCWNPDKLALVYSRADMPDTTVCNHYFQISETQVMRSVLRPWIRVGKEVQRLALLPMWKRSMSVMPERTKRPPHGCLWPVKWYGNSDIGKQKR